MSSLSRLFQSVLHARNELQYAEHRLANCTDPTTRHIYETEVMNLEIALADAKDRLLAEEESRRL